MTRGRRLVRATITTTVTALVMALAPITTAEAATVVAKTPAGIGVSHASQLAGHNQVVIVSGASMRSSVNTISLVERNGMGWKVVASFPGHNARNGWSSNHYEYRVVGAMTSPIGVFPLTNAGGYLPNPGAGLPYQHLPWFYNYGGRGASSANPFLHMAAINYNHVVGTPPSDPRRPLGYARGGDIWFHSGRGATAGCISTSDANVVRTLRWLKSSAHPVIVMGPSSWLDPTRSVSQFNARGKLESATAQAGGIKVSGFAFDPDLARGGPIKVRLSVNGKTVKTVTTGKVRRDVSRTYVGAVGAGFVTTVSAPKGTWRVCGTALNVGLGKSTSIGCKTVRVTTNAADHNPIGSLDAVWASGSTITATGWAADRDGTPSVRILVDGQGGTTVKPTIARPDVAAHYSYAGTSSGFAATLEATPGAHQVCAVVLNVGTGTTSTVDLGCRTVIISAPPTQAPTQAPTEAPTEPPTESPTPSESPSESPSTSPSSSPGPSPTASPSTSPSSSPIPSPTASPSASPITSSSPTTNPSP